MAVCGNRTDTPGFFTPCRTALGNAPCECGRQVEEEQIAQATTEESTT